MDGDLKINEYILRLTGSATLPEKLNVGEDYTVGVSVCCDSVKIKSNEDGTFDLIYYCKLVSDVVVSNRWGRTVKARKKGSMSQKLRFVLMQKHSELGIT